MKFAFIFFVQLLAATARRKCKNGFHHHPRKCDAFYQCTNGYRYREETCPEGLLYNSQIQYCDWPKNVGCDSEMSKWTCYTDCVADSWWDMVQSEKCSKQCPGWNVTEVRSNSWHGKIAVVLTKWKNFMDHL